GTRPFRILGGILVAIRRCSEDMNNGFVNTLALCRWAPWQPLSAIVTIAVCALLATVSGAGAQSQWAPWTVPVTRVIDGRSFEVKIGDRVEIIRYAGIDTPEIQHPALGPDRYNEAARAANAQLVAGKLVQLVFDTQWRDR